MDQNQSDDSPPMGKLSKRIVFTETDHHHAQLLVRLQYDGLKQSQFFREFVRGYIEGDENIQRFIDDVKPQSAKKKTKSQKHRQQGKRDAAQLRLNEDQIEDIFDLIAEEHPDL